MSEIVPDLFLGDASAAMFPEVARYDVLVNVTREVPFSKCLSKHQITYRYDILDVDAGDQASMLQILPEASATIYRSLVAGLKVLVFCLEGKCRSVTVVCHYLMLYLNMSLEGAKNHLRLKHKASFDYGTYVHYEEALKHCENTKSQTSIQLLQKGP